MERERVQLHFLVEQWNFELLPREVGDRLGRQAIVPERRDGGERERLARDDDPALREGILPGHSLVETVHERCEPTHVGTAPVVLPFGSFSSKSLRLA